VYRGYQERFDRYVAIKVLNVDLADPVAKTSFLRECTTMGRFSGHPNIVTILDSGFAGDGRPYIAMEYFERGSLAQRMALGRRYSLAEVLRVGVKAAGALETTHREGVLHRDVKPHNILESPYGEPALADFGIATVRAQRVGGSPEPFALTVEYAPPEMLDGGEVAAAGDVYSLACTLYVLLSGCLPHRIIAGEPLEARARRIRSMRHPVPSRPEIAPEVLELLRHAMAPDAGSRPGSAEQFGGSLQRLQTRRGLAPTDLPIAGRRTELEREVVVVLRTPGQGARPRRIVVSAESTDGEINLRDGKDT
jgi:serine/threonine protein kinase